MGTTYLLLYAVPDSLAAAKNFPTISQKELLQSECRRTLLRQERTFKQQHMPTGSLRCYSFVLDSIVFDIVSVHCGCSFFLAHKTIICTCCAVLMLCCIRTRSNQTSNICR
jgi:hypothetical protein